VRSTGLTKLRSFFRNVQERYKNRICKINIHSFKLDNYMSLVLSGTETFEQLQRWRKNFDIFVEPESTLPYSKQAQHLYYVLCVLNQ
jgi:hypothetical protein